MPYPLLLVPAVLGMALASCSECVVSCPLELAVIVRVTAPPAGGPVNGAFIQVSGVTHPCAPQADASVCNVPGSAGKYRCVSTIVRQPLLAFSEPPLGPRPARAA